MLRSRAAEKDEESEEQSTFTFTINPSDAAKMTPGSSSSNQASGDRLISGSARAARHSGSDNKKIQRAKENQRKKSMVKKSDCLNEEDQRVNCVICGGSGSKECKGVDRDETAWLDDWMVVQMTPASERCIPIGPVRFRQRDPYNKAWFEHESFTIDNAYNRNHGAAYRPVHRACHVIIDRQADHSGENKVPGRRHFNLIKSGGRVFDVLHPPPSKFIADSSSETIRFNNGLNTYNWASKFDLEDPQTNYLAADPSFLSLETALEFSRDENLVLKDKPIRKSLVNSDSAANQKALSANLFARLPTELIHEIAFHILRLSGKQPFMCSLNWPEEKKKKKKKKRKRTFCPTCGVHHSDDPDDDDDDDDSEDDLEETDLSDDDDDDDDWEDEDDDGSNSDSDDDLLKNRFSKIFRGERSFLAWRASSRFLYHFSFDKSIWKRLVVGRAERFSPFSFSAPHSFYDHKCNQKNDPKVHACSNGFVSIKDRFTNIPMHSHQGSPPTSTNRHHWLRKVEKDTVDMIKDQDSLDPEDTYRTLAGLHCLRNAERIIAGWEDFERRVFTKSIQEEMLMHQEDEEDDDDDDDDMINFNPFMIPGMIPIGGNPGGGGLPDSLEAMMGGDVPQGAMEMLGGLFAELFAGAHHHHEDDEEDSDGATPAFFDDDDPINGDLPDPDDID